MNAQDILDLIGEAKGSFVWDAQQLREGDLTPGKRLSGKRIWLVAAVIALTALLVGCAVVYVLRLGDMKIGENTVTEPEHYGPGWEVIEAKEKTYHVLTVQGFADSPSQKAVREYRDYLDSIPEGTSDEEKREKCRQIARKYDLELLSEGISVSYDRSHILLDSLRLAGLCTGQPYANVEYSFGDFYPEGTFRIHLNLEPVSELLDWPYYIRVDYRYYQKGYFVYDFVSVEYLDSFREWEYIMPDGKPALLALGKEDALILAERENGMFCIQFDSRKGKDTMSVETMEKIADLFDFSILPHALSPEEWQSVEGEMARLDELEHQQYLVQQTQWEASAKKEGFAGWVKQTLEGKTYEEVKDMGYAFHDIDGNGIDDLLIGRDGYCTAVYWEVEGQTVQFSNAAMLLYPCKDQIIGYTLAPHDTNYFFSRVDNGASVGMANIRYVPGHPEGEYQKGDLEHWNRYEAITKEEFDSIMASYTRIPITFAPLPEYPLGEDVLLGEGQVQRESFESYADRIRMRLTSKEEQWPRWQYAIRDLNGDGEEEMIWSEDGRVWIYTTVNGGVIAYSMVSDGSITPCEEGIVEAVHHYGPVNKTYRYYRLEEDRAVLVEYLRYDADRDPENPWFRSGDLTGQDRTLEPISEGEALSIMASYEPLEIDMRPISEYPLG